MPNHLYDSMGWNFDNSYAKLPQILFADAMPIKVQLPKTTILNHELLKELGLNVSKISDLDLAALFAGQNLPNNCKPIAQAYAGHQFGGFTMLGDGRAILLGEHLTPAGKLFDIQFKGSGPTPYSRRGDGRAALGPMLREYIISEAMHALDIPSTRSLAVATTGEPVFRETTLPGAILTRIAASHIRVGTFEFVAGIADEPALQSLADYTIGRHYPDLTQSPDKYRLFLQCVIDKQASLIARWQLVGFIHGVMNTDNMAISGETIDYGPCAFMDTFKTNTVFSSIDRGGRYAYSNQPKIAQWNLTRFAETLLPLLNPSQEKAIEIATELLNEFPALFDQYWLQGMRKKLGLAIAEENDTELIQALLTWMESSRADFTNTFRDLSFQMLPPNEIYLDEKFIAWNTRWQSRLKRQNLPLQAIHLAMQKVNPSVIPRNHLVEEVLASASESNDLSLLHELLKVLVTPFDYTMGDSKYNYPGAHCSTYRTFCGT